MSEIGLVRESHECVVEVRGVLDEADEGLGAVSAIDVPRFFRRKRAAEDFRVYTEAEKAEHGDSAKRDLRCGWVQPISQGLWRHVAPFESADMSAHSKELSPPEKLRG